MLQDQLTEQMRRATPRGRLNSALGSTELHIWRLQQGQVILTCRLLRLLFLVFLGLSFRYSGIFIGELAQWMIRRQVIRAHGEEIAAVLDGIETAEKPLEALVDPEEAQMALVGSLLEDSAAA